MYIVGDYVKRFVNDIRKCYRDMDKILLFVTLFLFLFGLFNIVTASSSEAVNRYGLSLYHYFYRQLKILALGVAAFFVIIRIDMKKYNIISKLFYLVASGLLVWLFVRGTFHKGAQNWLSIGGFKFQPSEFVKPAIIAFLACYFDRMQKKLRNTKANHIGIIGVILFAGLFDTAIVFFQKDLGTMFIIFSIFAVMFLSSPILSREKNKTILISIVALLFGIMAIISLKGSLLSKEQQDRFNFFNPCGNYLEGGYQICNAFIAINNGGALGLGIGKSQQKYSYIPEPHTDMVFAIVAEEQGFIRSSVVFLCYAIILYRICKLSSVASTLKGKYICLGVATYIFLHILINMGGLFGIMPLTGVPLPFLSYGGSFTLSLIISLTLVQRVSIETSREKIVLVK